MYILFWIIFGGFVGWIASLLTGNDKEMGCITNIAVGIAGAAIGSWLSVQLGLGTYRTFSLYGMFIAIIGSVLLLTILNVFSQKRY